MHLRCKVVHLCPCLTHFYVPATKAAQVFCRTRLGFINCYGIGKSMEVKGSKVSSGQDSLVPQWK